MELEELKSSWTYVQSQIEFTSCQNIDKIPKGNTIDVKSKVLIRLRLNVILTAIAFFMMSTCRLWSPTKFPMMWVVLVCMFIFLSILAELYLIRLIKKINLCEDTNSEVLMAIIKIKKYYKNMELAGCIMASVMIIWISLTPLFVWSWGMLIVWGLLAIGISLEYFWYRSNFRYLNRLSNWDI